MAVTAKTTYFLGNNFTTEVRDTLIWSLFCKVSNVHDNSLEVTTSERTSGQWFQGNLSTFCRLRYKKGHLGLIE
jgi:hypothetical protein